MHLLIFILCEIREKNRFNDKRDLFDLSQIEKYFYALCQFIYIIIYWFMSVLLLKLFFGVSLIFRKLSVKKETFGTQTNLLVKKQKSFNLNAIRCRHGFFRPLRRWRFAPVIELTIKSAIFYPAFNSINVLYSINKIYFVLRDFYFGSFLEHWLLCK